MKTPEQVKGAIRNIANQKGIRPQAALQMYLLERLPIRIAGSQYHGNFVLKGGLLISSMLGIANRTTMDMDATVKGISMDETNLLNVVREIIESRMDDEVRFQIEGIERIREGDEYHNFRIALSVVHGSIHAPMKIDLTTGDMIVPDVILYDFPLMFDDESVQISAYPLETILAEKYETIISRNVANTRARDFYDLHMLVAQFYGNIRKDILKEAVQKTAEKRESMSEINESDDIIQEIRQEKLLQRLWDNYAQKNPYVRDITFLHCISSLETIAALLR